MLLGKTSMAAETQRNGILVFFSLLSRAYKLHLGEQPKCSLQKIHDAILAMK
jgi:hypothetical protein